jgi:hypothetical protein
VRKTFVIGLASLAMLAVPALPASADARVTVQHENFTLPVQVFDDPDYCASYGLTFHVVEHETVVLTIWRDADGNTFKVFVHHNLSFDLSANGKTLHESDHYNNTFTLIPNSNPPQFTAVTLGNETHIRGDNGIVLLDAGRIVEDATGNVTFITGPHPQFLGGTFCSALLP